MSADNIDILMITHNRLEYTRLSLDRLLSSKEDQYRLTIWDNASSDGTKDYLRNEVHDSRIADVIFSKENVGATEAMNRVWSRSKAELLGKVDNDCLVTPGWTRTLSQAHRDVAEFGVIACWHYFLDDFDEKRAAHKIQSFHGHRVLRHPWTCGTGFLIKRSAFERVGPMPGAATTKYWIQMAKAGFVNGFYMPLIFQEHMDDPKSEHSMLKDEASYQAAKSVTFNINRHGQHTLADRWVWRQKVLDELLDGPWKVSAYVGWRAKIKRKLNRIRNIVKSGKNK